MEHAGRNLFSAVAIQDCPVDFVSSSNGTLMRISLGLHIFCYMLQKAGHFSVICCCIEFFDPAVSGASVSVTPDV
jgi:hypothetical protein